MAATRSVQASCELRFLAATSGSECTGKVNYENLLKKLEDQFRKQLLTLAQWNLSKGIVFVSGVQECGKIVTSTEALSNYFISNYRVQRFQRQIYDLLVAFVTVFDCRMTVKSALAHFILATRTGRLAFAERQILPYLLRTLLLIPISDWNSSKVKKRISDRTILLLFERPWNSSEGPSLPTHATCEPSSSPSTPIDMMLPTVPDDVIQSSPSNDSNLSGPAGLPTSKISPFAVPVEVDWLDIHHETYAQAWKNARFWGLCTLLQDQPLAFQFDYYLPPTTLERAFGSEVRFYDYRFDENEIEVDGAQFNFGHGLYVMRSAIPQVFGDDHKKLTIDEIRSSGSPSIVTGLTADEKVHDSMLNLSYRVSRVNKEMQVKLYPKTSSLSFDNPLEDDNFHKVADILSPLTLMRLVFGPGDKIPMLLKPELRFGGKHAIIPFSPNPYDMPQLALNANHAGIITAYIIPATDLPELERRAWSRVPDSPTKPQSSDGLFNSGQISLGLKGLLGELKDDGSKFRIWSASMSKGRGVLIPAGCLVMFHFETPGMLLQFSFPSSIHYGTPFETLPTLGLRAVMSSSVLFKALLTQHRAAVGLNACFSRACSGYSTPALLTLDALGQIVTVPPRSEPPELALGSSSLTRSIFDSDSEIEDYSPERSTSYDSSVAIFKAPLGPSSSNWSSRKRPRSPGSELLLPSSDLYAQCHDSPAPSIADTTSSLAALPRICVIQVKDNKKLCKEYRTKKPFPAGQNGFSSYKKHLERCHRSVYLECFGKGAVAGKRRTGTASAFDKLHKKYGSSIYNQDQDLGDD